MLLAAYGSLKKGYYNHPLLDNSELFGESKVNGVMYSNGSYPKLYRPVADSGIEVINDTEPLAPQKARDHRIEVYYLTDEQYAPIKQMELGAGYTEEEVPTEWGPAKIFYMPQENFRDDDWWVKEY